ncbi:MAG: heavy metal translocating P-type ATPase [Elusimicrobiota bacterium]
MREVSTLRLLVGCGLTAGILLDRSINLSPYTVWGLSLPVFVWCGGPFHAGLLRCFVTQRANTNMLISLSTWAAFLYSTLAVFAPRHLLPGAQDHMLGAMGCLIVAATFGRWLEIRLTERSGEALGKLNRRIPHTARRLRGDGPDGPVENVLSASLGEGDRVLVRPGEQIPVDGKVLTGASHVDESLWTRSTALIEKTAGSHVLCGTQNKDSDIVVAVERSSTNSELAQMITSIREGFALKSVRAGIADGLAGGYVPAVVIAAVAATLIWSWQGPEPRLTNALTVLSMVLFAACPWAVTIASPAALALGLRRAGRMRIRIRNPGVLEKLDRADILILDKKGILTEGRPSVRDVVCFGRWNKEELLRRATIVEKGTGHPFSGALLRSLNGRELPDADSHETYPGRGVAVSYAGDRILAGSPEWLAEQGIELPASGQRLLREKTDSLMALAVEGEAAGIISFTDELRPGARDAVRTLAAMGIEVVLASGDRNPAAHDTAQQVGIRRVFSEVQGEDKVQIVEDLQSQGKKVVMLGDRMRDAAALSRADLGISLGAERAGMRRPDLGASIDLAAESADVILLQRDLDHLLSALRLCLKIREVVRENLKWAFGIQLVLISAAAGALYAPFAVRLPPAAPGAAAAVSILAILIHSILRFKRKEDETKKTPDD